MTDLSSVQLHRGSRKHVLDLVDSDSYLGSLNSLLATADATVEAADLYRPLGHREPDEFTIRAFCKEAGLTSLASFNYEEFNRWWVPDEYRNPQWDLLSTCTIAGRRGLVLGEAKAHENEVSEAGKPIDTEKSSAQTRRNHEIIRGCVAEAAAGLQPEFPGVRISIESHYQLGNRLATAWKLASCGLPVVLLYLGFTGDTGIRDVGPELKDAAHWRRIMLEHASAVFPPEAVDRTVALSDAGSMRLSIDALPVIAVSDPPAEPLP